MLQVGPDNKEHLISCNGRALRPNEVNFSTVEKEALALVTACQKYRHLLQGRRFEVKTDNLGVKFLCNLKITSSPRLLRWSIYLSPLISNAIFQHVKGVNHTRADSLSRLDFPPTEGISQEEEDLIDDDLNFCTLHQDPPQDQPSQEFRITLPESMASYRTTDPYNGSTGTLQDYLQFKHAHRCIEDFGDAEKFTTCDLCNMEWNHPNKIPHEPDPLPLFPEPECKREITDSPVIVQHVDLDWNLLENSDIVSKFLASDSQLATIDDSNQSTDFTATQDLGSNYDDLIENDHNPHSEAWKQLGLQAPDPSLYTELQEESPADLHYATDVILLTTNDAEFARLQRSSPELKPWFEYFDTSSLPKDEKWARRIIHMEEYVFINEKGVLCQHKRNNNPKTRDVINDHITKIVPAQLQQQLLQSSHCFNHGGSSRLFSELNRDFTWNGLYKDCVRHVTECLQCAVAKRGQFQNKQWLKSVAVAGFPSHSINIDIVGPLNVVDDFRWLLTAVDAFTGYVFLIPLKSKCAVSVSQGLLEIFSSCGFPLRLISDQDPSFLSEVVQTLFKRLNVRHATSSTYHSRSNGKIERVHREFGNLICTTLTQEQLQNSWPSAIAMITSASPQNLG